MVMPDGSTGYFSAKWDAGGIDPNIRQLATDLTSVLPGKHIVMREVHKA